MAEILPTDNGAARGTRREQFDFIFHRAAEANRTARSLTSLCVELIKPGTEIVFTGMTNKNLHPDAPAYTHEAMRYESPAHIHIADFHTRGYDKLPLLQVELMADKDIFSGYRFFELDLDKVVWEYADEFQPEFSPSQTERYREQFLGHAATTGYVVPQIRGH